MKIAIGNDHTAIEMKEIIKEFVEGKGYEVIDLGTNSTESCDYPVYGEKGGRAGKPTWESQSAEPVWESRWQPTR